MVNAVTEKPRWKKNLYENLNYADNYTDETFLNGLKTNLNIRNIQYLEAFNASFLGNFVKIIIQGQHSISY